jgi:hypothetical protein
VHFLLLCVCVCAVISATGQRGRRRGKKRRRNHHAGFSFFCITDCCSAPSFFPLFALLDCVYISTSKFYSLACVGAGGGLLFEEKTGKREKRKKEKRKSHATQKRETEKKNTHFLSFSARARKRERERERERCLPERRRERRRDESVREICGT